MDANCLAPALFRYVEDCSKIVGNERGMIEITTVLIGPLQTVITQGPGKSIEIDRVVGADRIVSDRQLEKQGYERATDNANAAKIASALHRWNFSIFGADLFGVPSRLRKGSKLAPALDHAERDVFEVIYRANCRN